jgi:hypothetical protein
MIIWKKSVALKYLNHLQARYEMHGRPQVYPPDFLQSLITWRYPTYHAKWYQIYAKEYLESKLAYYQQLYLKGELTAYSPEFTDAMNVFLKRTGFIC